MRVFLQTLGLAILAAGPTIHAALVACLLLGALFLPTRVCVGRELFVSPSGWHQPPYTNWASASTSIYAAVETAVDGDTVTVTDGLYMVSSQVSLTNGITVRGAHGADATTVSGGYPATSNRCFYLSHSNAVLDGFTISNGVAFGAGLYEGMGGGVLCENSGRVVRCILIGNRATTGGGAACSDGGTVMDTTVRSNTVTLFGGGVFCQQGGVVESCNLFGNNAELAGGGALCWYGGTVRNCTIEENTGSDGSGITLYRGGVLEDSTCRGNVAESRGGGVVIYEVGVARNSVIVGNMADQGGGAVVDTDGDLENCIISGNTANTGGGVAFSRGGTLRHCSVTTNSARTDGGGVYCWWGGEVVNAIVYGNMCSNSPDWFNNTNDVPDPDFVYTNFFHSCTLPLPPGWGNITNDPQFANAATGNYHLVQGSPCIDAGTNLPGMTNDFDGVPRPLDGNDDGQVLADMGVYEFVHPTADSDADSMPDAWELDHALDPVVDDGSQDLDADHASNAGEYAADTDPHDADSQLRVFAVAPALGGIRLDWKGGREAWQFLECREQLAPTSTPWTALFAVPPPTPLTNAIIDLGATNAVLFYRIRVER